jgi:ribose transport system substrate-binding protein
VTFSKSIVIAATVAVGVVALGLGACGDDSDNSDDSGSASDITVGYSFPGRDQFQLIQADTAVGQIEEQGMTALEPISANFDAGKQISDIQTLVSQGANAMMVVPADSSAIKPAIDSLNSKDIPIVSIDISPENAEVDMVVRANNVQMGADACEEMGGALDGKGTVLSMQGDYKTTNGRDRGEGFKNCMDEQFPDIEVLECPTEWDAAKAADCAETQLTADSEIAGVYMASDTVMLAPVLSALKSVGRDAKVGEPGHVYLASIDGSPFGLEQIRAGNLDVLLSQPLDLYAKYGAEYLTLASEGETFSPGPTDHDSKIVEDEAGNLQDLLPAPLVTKENASDPDLWGNSVK